MSARRRTVEPGTIFEDTPTTPWPANSTVDLEAIQFFQMSGGDIGGADFLAGKLWVPMDIAIDVFEWLQIWAVLVDDGCLVSCSRHFCFVKSDAIFIKKKKKDLEVQFWVNLQRL